MKSADTHVLSSDIVIHFIGDPDSVDSDFMDDHGRD